MKLLHQTSQIWDDLENVASQHGLLPDLKALRAQYEPHWKALDTICSTLLTVKYVTDIELQTFDAAVDRYFHGIQTIPGLQTADDHAPHLSRHAIKHAQQLLHRGPSNKHNAGLFSESAFESLHAVINDITARCNHIRGAIAHDAAVRKQLLIRRSPAARAARERHRQSVARGSRAPAPPAGPAPGPTPMDVEAPAA
mmetsp:Transcript_4221/g.12439  ORF Transcript_4221/g.12439 Transcript_4221/m.12439 type:complete len:197 (+) Transcript_4221:637-1227(+)